MTSVPSARVSELVAQLTLEEKCQMVAGASAWIVHGCERLGVPEWCVSDGPVGVRGRALGPGLVVPGPSAMAATWNPVLVREVGAALGAECRDRKVDVLLAPTVNLHRSPRGGRHFESYSEDPELSSRTAVAYIEGVQSEGVGACVKHFVANDQEHERFTINVEVDERSLREIYLPPFEAAVTEAKVRSVMGAYNFVNGQHACAHDELLVDLLKREWEFDGFVVSDWGALKETVAPAVNGLDLEMPGPGRHWGRGQLQAAVESSEVDSELVDDKVARLLGFLEWAGRLDTATDHEETSIERPEHRELAHRAATEATVLIKNTGLENTGLENTGLHDVAVDNRGAENTGLENAGLENTGLENTGLHDVAVERTSGEHTGDDETAADHLGAPLLPIAEGQTVALIGPGARETALLGGGSATLLPHRTTTVADALAERIGDRLIGTAPGIDMRRGAGAVPPEWIERGQVHFEIFDGTDHDGTDHDGTDHDGTDHDGTDHDGTGFGGTGFDGELLGTETSDSPFNVWMDDRWPEGADAISVRVRFTLVPKQSGRHRFTALGFHHSRLYVDDVLVADNEDGRFSAGLGQHGGSGDLDLEAGRNYEIRLDNQAHEPGQWLCLVDVGIEAVDEDPEAMLTDAAELAAAADVAVVVVGSTAEWESEGADRTEIVLPNGQDELVMRVVEANPRTVVVLNCGAPMLLPWLDRVPGVLLAWYPGQEGGEAISAVLTGAAEPGGRMPTSWVADERQTPSFLNYPGEAGVVRYGEGVFVGYRGHDARGVEPMIPFGHGGSYATFEWGEPSVRGVVAPPDTASAVHASGSAGAGSLVAPIDSLDDIVVQVPVTNTSGRHGTEVIQVYTAPSESPVSRPPKELAGFVKLYLGPGETRTAEIRLRDRAFSRWDPAVHAWVVDPGEWSVLVAASAVDIRHATPLVLEAN